MFFAGLLLSFFLLHLAADRYYILAVLLLVVFLLIMTFLRYFLTPSSSSSSTSSSNHFFRDTSRRLRLVVTACLPRGVLLTGRYNHSSIFSQSQTNEDIDLKPSGFGNTCQPADFMIPRLDHAPRWAPVSVARSTSFRMTVMSTIGHRTFFVCLRSVGQSSVNT